MKNIKLIAGGLLLIGSVSASFPLMAADIQTSHALQFKKGTSSAIVNGSVTGRGSDDYTLVAREGQLMHVEMVSKFPYPYFNVITPSGKNIFADTSGEPFEAKLPESGRYVIRPYQMGAAKSEGKTSHFTLKVKITN